MRACTSWNNGDILGVVAAASQALLLAFPLLAITYFFYNLIVRPLRGLWRWSKPTPGRIKVWEALDLFSSLAPNGKDWRVPLEQWGLSGKEKSSFGSLSGGERQRLFLALALVNQPEVVFLDELTQGLDPGARRVAWALIREIRDRGTTVILVTHFMEEAEALCDRLAIVDRQRVIATGTPQELIASSERGIQVRFSTDREDISWLSDVEHVEQVERQGDHVEVRGSGPVLALVAAALVGHGIVPVDLRVEQATLEDIFLELTGRTKGEDW